MTGQLMTAKGGAPKGSAAGAAAPAGPVGPVGLGGKLPVGPEGLVGAVGPVAGPQGCPAVGIETLVYEEQRRVCE
jgi:hypothetical protein